MDLPIDVDHVRAVLRDHGVRFALVFGSHAKGRGTARSDVDLAVYGDRAVGWDLRGALPDEVDLIDLRVVPDGLAGRIAIEGEVVLDDDPVARIRWQAETRKRHLDEARRRRQFRRDFVNAHG